MYKVIRPHQLLAEYVDAYWVSAATQCSRQRILPDACADIIFNIGGETIATGSGEIIIPNTAFVVGTMTTFQDAVMQAHTRMLGVRFRPGGLNAFTELPLQLITDEDVALREIAPGWHSLLEPLLARKKHCRQKLIAWRNSCCNTYPCAIHLQIK